MKQLFIIRHAKSSREDFSIIDFERPLNERGFADANAMADYLKNNTSKIDLIISSPAKRALTTAKIFAEKFNYSEDDIILEKSIYNFTDNGNVILSIFRNSNDQYNTIALFGHNNTLLNLVHRLSNEDIEHFPTCSIASVEFQVEKWNEIDTKNASMNFCMTPKDLS